ncbi:MAG TPA: lamin tail domain-containing protein [Candidatus Eisenbacteria bacterium]|nr:lamin tail domain-containing protein [Candidatus Eisenbacteria bacterium]
MHRAFLIALAVLSTLPATAGAFTVSGRFLYEDRVWDKDGYTGQVQNLPIRHARVEVVDLAGGLALATGTTDTAGFYSLDVTGLTLPVSFYVRCTADATPAGYYIKVYDNFVRVPTVRIVTTGAMLYAIRTDNTLAHSPASNIDKGTFVIQDVDGSGVAQAFNILDNGIDFWDWIASPELKGSLPTANDSLIFAWKPLGSPGNAANGFGSNYSMQGIYIGADTTDTDGWSDTVILHEAGHWYDDLFSGENNPGGAHFIGDNNANVLLSYGEGAATYHCAKVREYRAFHHRNLIGQPIDDHVSVYGDLMIPPPVGTPGGLSFGYDFETGNFSNGTPIGQRGSANETNVTTALWDLMDGPETPDETPGADDDDVNVSDSYAWNIEHHHLRSLSANITVEDYYQGWFLLNGATFLKPQVDHVFNTLAQMPWHVDAFEPDNTLTTAKPLTIQSHDATVGHVVISELDLGPQDCVELYNASPAAVDMTGWQVQVYVNDDTQQQVSRIYVFDSFTIQPGDAVAIWERGDESDNGRYHRYAGSTNPQAFNASWDATVDGACVLRNAQMEPVDFVKWSDPLGTPNGTPVPAGTAFTGALGPPPSNSLHLARDIHGTDTDSASDWSYRDGTLASANYSNPILRTSFDTGDQDLFSFQALAGTRYGFEARGPYSATDPQIELLSPTGTSLGVNNNSDPGVRDARLDFFAGVAGTYYLRVKHVGANTDWGEYELVGFQRPPNNSLQAPSGLSATASHTSDTADRVAIQWLNASTYDAVNVYRDDVLIATLEGSPSSYNDQVPRGLYRYEVSGKRAETETARTSGHEFAGLIGCHAEEDFESASAANWIIEGGTWGVTPISSSGSWGFTDSPAGLYTGCPTGASGCTTNATATFGVPALLPPGSTLEFDQICATENDFDYGIVEVSADHGTTWNELARFDMGDDPAWGTGVADPSAYRHASLSLGAFAHQMVQVRFRLQSDANLEYDGWYIDNVQINDENCTPVVAVTPPAAQVFRLMAPSPNPSFGRMRFAFTLPRKEEVVEVRVFDALGRQLRADKIGPLVAGHHSWEWNGRDASGREVGAGGYFVRLQAGGLMQTRKAFRLSR